MQYSYKGRENSGHRQRHLVIPDSGGSHVRVGGGTPNSPLGACLVLDIRKERAQSRVAFSFSVRRAPFLGLSERFRDPGQVLAGGDTVL